MTYAEWESCHPEAAAELFGLICAMPWRPPVDADEKSETWAQQQIRFKIARRGGMAWRNNVGATPVRCKACGEKQRPVRYGLANDSHQLNKAIKSSDLIGVIPRRVTPGMVGGTIAQFAAIEAKRPGWRYAGTEREQAQAAWLALIVKLGGFATFSTGDIEL